MDEAAGLVRQVQAASLGVASSSGAPRSWLHSGGAGFTSYGPPGRGLLRRCVWWLDTREASVAVGLGYSEDGSLYRRGCGQSGMASYGVVTGKAG